MAQAETEDHFSLRWKCLERLRWVLDGRAPNYGARKSFWGRPDWVIVDAAIEAGIDPRVALNAMGLYVS